MFPQRHIQTSTSSRVAGTVEGYARSSHEASFGPFGQVLIGIKGDTTGCELLVFDPKEPTDAPLTSTCVVNGAYEIQQL